MTCRDYPLQEMQIRNTLKHTLVGNKSSYLVFWPVIIFLGAALIASFLFKLRILPFILSAFLLLAIVSRIWITYAGRKMEIKMTGEVGGLFPGQEGAFVFRIRNQKMLPVIWADLFYPLSPDQCILPENTRPALEWEKPALQEIGASEEIVGESHLYSFSWYESKTVTVRWTAKRRGIYSNLGWSLRTGDGFGLGQSEQKLGREYQRKLAVFPAQIPVNSDLLIKNVWNSDTGTRGILEDHTVIRSVRDYLPGDNMKHINWRLAARGLPLSVNVYEEILPQNTFFIFDGESFSGPSPHEEEMELAMSILGSAAVSLGERNIRCGLSMSSGIYEDIYRNTPVYTETEDVLWALAAYKPAESVKDESNSVIRQMPVFDPVFIQREAQSAGRCYYICYDPDSADRGLIQSLGEGKAVVLSFASGELPLPCSRMDIRSLVRGTFAADASGSPVAEGLKEQALADSGSVSADPVSSGQSDLITSGQSDPVNSGRGNSDSPMKKGGRF